MVSKTRSIPQPLPGGLDDAGILDTFARTIGVNAGVRIISGNTAPVGVGVNISP